MYMIVLGALFRIVSCSHPSRPGVGVRVAASSETFSALKSWQIMQELSIVRQNKAKKFRKVRIIFI